jgi:hypothetical protein
MLAAMTKSADITNEVILKCQDKGLILFWLLFEELQSESHRHLLFLKKREGCNNAKVMDEIYNRVIFRSCFLPLVHPK